MTRTAVDRAARAATLTLAPLGDGVYLINGHRCNESDCDCPDRMYRSLICAHMLAVRARANGSGSHDEGPGLADADVPPPDLVADAEPDASHDPEDSPPLESVRDAIPPTREPSQHQGTAAAADAEERASDTGNARRLVRLHGVDLRHVRQERRWYAWDERRWRPDATGEAERRAKAVIDTLFVEAAAETDSTQRKALANHAIRSDNAMRIRAMLELASTDTAVVLRPEQLDAGAWLLNVQNGTLDLRTAELRPHRRSDYLTKLAPVPWDPDAKAPRWERFLAEITAADDALASFLQRAVGYSLTGDTREQCLFFCHGTGANGKTVFLEAIQATLGQDYAATADFNTFLACRRDGPRNDVARLRAVRLVAASESPGGQPFDESLLKQLVGGDTIAARFLHQEYFEFKPAFKLWLRANHRPPVREQTVAFWRRMRLVPFTVTIKDEHRDRELPAKLRAELPGILAWGVRGCLAWQKQGLGEPKVVTDATAAYRAENDLVGEFIDARCVLEPSAWTPAADLYKAFVGWWEETRGKEHAPSSRAFGRALGERGDLLSTVQGHKKTRGWCGIRLPIGAGTSAGGSDALPF